MPLVVPTPVPAYPPAPQPTDDRVTFSTKAFALAASYEPQRLAFNTALDQVYINAQWAQAKALDAQNAAVAAGQSASAANTSRVAADQAVQDVRDAMDAIQAGPVASVMGRTGVVTGLTERALGQAKNSSSLMANAPNGQWVAYSSLNGAGSDWPTNANISWWNVLTLGGDDGVGNDRKVQIASQTFTQGGQSSMFIRAKHDAVWGRWQRIFTDGALIESSRVQYGVGAVITCDPAVASMHFVGLNANTTVNVPAPRAGGDQLTIRIYQAGSHSLTFTGPIVLPMGATLPAIGQNRWLTVTLVPNDTVNTWSMFIGGIH